MKKNLVLVLALCAIPVLLQAAAPMNWQVNEELIGAVRDSDAIKVKELLGAGADANTALFGGTALMHAASRKNVGIVEMLLEAGADVNAANQLGNTALNSAAFKGRTGIVEILLRAGANKGTAEQRARDKGHNDTADFIRDYGFGGLTKSAGKR
jgi:ankyrin repeat protein